MSPTRIEQPAEPICLDLTAALSFEHGLGRAELLKFGPQLEEARRTLLADAKGSFRRPQQLLADYQKLRNRSTLGQILTAAKRLRESVDRAVILAPQKLISAAQMLFAACCHPQHNDLSRGQRGGRPRIFFAATQPDNDALQGLLDILPHGRQLHTVDERWGIVALDDGNCGNLAAALFGLFWEALQTTAEPHTEAQFAIAVGQAESPLMEFAARAECQRIELAENCEPANATVWDLTFHPGVLLAASVMGTDVVKLLRGAALMADRFASTPPGDNPALDLAGLRHLLSVRRGTKAWILDPCDAALQPLAQSGPQPDQSAEHLLIQLISRGLRRDRLRVTMRAAGAAATEKKRITRYLPELAAAQFQAVRDARAAAGQPTAVVQLPVVDESSIGQLVQLFSIADAIEQILSIPDS